MHHVIPRFGEQLRRERPSGVLALPRVSLVAYSYNRCCIHMIVLSQVYGF